MLAGMKETRILAVENGVVRLGEDALTCTYSIGLRTDQGVDWKFISKELHDLLVKELSDRK